ncbi:MAG TPA: 30S ribosome-binding factor RbfA [Polyangia bacterium]|nr:30S ribosome-binding factor RbfA [Polyangia bacterium]
MQGARTERVAQVVREAVTEALAYGAVKDPRVAQNGLITVTHVLVSGDLRHAKVYVVVHDGDVASAVNGLGSAAGFLRRQVAERLRARAVPELRFYADEGFDRAQNIERLLAEVAVEKKE